MSRMVSFRLDEALVRRVDKERQKDGLSRAQAVQRALEVWVRQCEQREAVRLEHEGYSRKPVTANEFGPVLGAQQWPK